MACSDYDTLREFWANIQPFDAAYCYYANTLSGEFTQLIVFLTLGLALYAYSREPIVPLVLAIIFGAVFITPLPAAVAATATLFGVILTAGALYLLVRRMRQGVV